MKLNIYVILLVCVLGAVVGANFALAATFNVKPQMDILAGVGLPSDSPLNVIVKVVRILLSTVAVIFLVLIIYAGFRWMTSGGNSEAIESAKKTMMAAIIGIVVIFLAYAITLFVFGIVMKV